MSKKTPWVVEIRHLCKRYGDRIILNDLCISIASGEFVAITGSSGSGKSTLLNIIGLLDGSDLEGEVRLFGELAPRSGSRRARMLLRSKIAYLFQNAALIEDITADANLKVAQRYANASRSERCALRSSALDAVGLGGRGGCPVYLLSGGERQRLALACLRMRPCELILADEPTGSLDAGNRDVVLEHFKSLAAEGKTLIVVTHDPVVAACAARVIEI